MDETGHAGFTLTELLITLALAALLAGLAVPAMSRLVDNGRLRGAAEQLTQDLRQARNRALTLQQDVYLSFAAPPGGAWCYGWRAGRRCDCRLQTALPGACRDGAGLQRRDAGDFPRVALHGPRRARVSGLRFAALRGTAEAGSFALQNAAGEVRVIVSPLGRVRACAVSGRVFAPC